MTRISAHKIAEKAVNVTRDVIAEYSSKGGESAIFRELSGMDYGVDGIVELFENDMPTGKIAFLQIKGTLDSISSLRKTPVVSCTNVSKSSIDYARQNNIPVILCYVSVHDKAVYYIELQSILEEVGDVKEGQKKTIHIPTSNKFEIDCEGIIKIIKSYY